MTKIGLRTLGLWLVGFGLLVLVGISLYVLASQRADNALVPTDFAAIPALVHYPAPNVALTALDGVQHSLDEYRGQVVLVNLWATWCPPCQAEMPLLEKFYERHRAEGFTVVAIEDGEPETDVRSFVKQYALTFPVWLDPKHTATDQAFKTINLPTSYIIDVEGQVRLTWLGAISEANLEKYVTPIINER